jgi:hypothetical protein
VWKPSRTRGVRSKTAVDGTPLNAFDEVGLPRLDDFFRLVTWQRSTDTGER